MKSILIELHCPTCGCVTHKKSETLIIPSFEPKLREELLSDTFFQQECPCCHTSIEFLHPLLYQDSTHRFIVLLQIPSQNNLPEIPQELDFQKRIVFDKEELKEKIHIFEDGLQDIVMEQLKDILLKKYGNLYYYDYDADSDTLWFTNGQGLFQMKAIQKSYYDQLEKQNTISINTNKLEMVNRDTYKNRMK